MQQWTPSISCTLLIKLKAANDAVASTRDGDDEEEETDDDEQQNEDDFENASSETGAS